MNGRCQLCGRKTEELYSVPVGDSFIQVCSICYAKKKPDKKLESGVVLIHPLLVLRHSPLSAFIARIHSKEAVLPLGISISKEEKPGEIDWNVLVGAEPIDDLKAKGVPYVLVAKFAEDQGAVTAREVANYLTELAKNPELEPYLERFKDVNPDYARKILDELAEMGIVKKEAKKGERGANIYDYFSAERSWRKE